MSMLGTRQPTAEDYKKTRMTKQSFKDSTDINKILKKAQTKGTVAHLQKYPAMVYGEFTGQDLQESLALINKANEIFAEAPSEIRREFDNDALKFAAFASDPANIDRLPELLPKIAEPGSYFPNPVKRSAVEPVSPQPAPEGGDAPSGTDGGVSPPESV